MERYVFIHGSSVGQSIIAPPDSPDSICNDIANKYFQGRTLRQKQSGAKHALFVDLYKDQTGKSYCIYSFVSNDCIAANGREGQYFALTLLCKGYYVYPESVYMMLHSAYSQMCKTGKILKVNSEKQDQYVVAQFSEQKDYLLNLLPKIGEYFDRISGGTGRALDSDCKAADYDSWSGHKVNLDLCNSGTIFNEFCKTGRLFISEEYASQTEKIKELEGRLQKLTIEKAEIEQRGLEAKQLEKSKVREELEALNTQIKQKDAQIESLKSDNKKYESTIKVVSSELDKYAKASKSVTDFQEKKSQYQAEGKKDILKTCLLFLLLILTVASGIMNYCFFRNLSPSSKKENGEAIVERVTATNPPIVPPKAEEPKPQTENEAFIIVPIEYTFPADGGDFNFTISSNSEWEVPNSLDWLSFKKKDGKTLTVQAKKNDTKDKRITRFTISEKQIKIEQEGKVQTTSAKPDFGLVVKDDKGAVMNPNSAVSTGQTLHATVTKPAKQKNGYGWRFFNCTGNDNGQNNKDVDINITGNSGQVTIAYGPVSNGSTPAMRQNITFKIENSTPND